MTREEAYNRIDAIIAKHELVMFITRLDYDALRMAKEALKQEPKLLQALELEKGAYNALVKKIQCSDCISRQAVLEIIRKCNCQGWVKVDIGEPIEALQPVNPAEKVGRWEWVQYDGNPKIGNYHCSACLCIVEDGKPSYKYCPQCGAKMEGSD